MHRPTGRPKGLLVGLFLDITKTLLWLMIALKNFSKLCQGIPTWTRISESGYTCCVFLVDFKFEPLTYLISVLELIKFGESANFQNKDT